MEYRRLGRSGLRLSILSYGSWVTFKTQVDTRLAEEMMALAYDQGVNFFDNAEAYAGGDSEVIMGEALKKLGWSRDSYCVSSKVFWGGPKPTQRGLHRKHVIDACNAALRRLQTDYLDLYYCHRPDIETPIEETVRTMNDLIRQGKVLYWGTSEWSAQQLTEAHRVAAQLGLVGPTVEQPEYNMFARQKIEADYLPIYETYGLGTTTWSPLASGLLTGKYNQGIPKGSRADLASFQWIREQFESPEGQSKIARVKQLGELAEQLEISLTHLALVWCLKNPHVTSVILGASRVEQLEQNLECLQHFAAITPEVMIMVDDIMMTRPKPPVSYL